MESIVNLLPWAQIILSVLLVMLVLLQRNDSALGAGFGGGATDNVERTRRGSEKTLFNATIVVSVLFVLSTVVTLFIQ